MLIPSFSCPCCSSLLLRHVRASGLYWYCPHCHAEMPNLALYAANQVEPAPQLPLVLAAIAQPQTARTLLFQKPGMQPPLPLSA